MHIEQNRILQLAHKKEGFWERQARAHIGAWIVLTVSSLVTRRSLLLRSFNTTAEGLAALASPIALPWSESSLTSHVVPGPVSAASTPLRPRFSSLQPMICSAPLGMRRVLNCRWTARRSSAHCYQADSTWGILLLKKVLAYVSIPAWAH